MRILTVLALVVISAALGLSAGCRGERKPDTDPADQELQLPEVD